MKARKLFQEKFARGSNIVIVTRKLTFWLFRPSFLPFHLSAEIYLLTDRWNEIHGAAIMHRGFNSFSFIQNIYPTFSMCQALVCRGK